MIEPGRRVFRFVWLLGVLLFFFQLPIHAATPAAVESEKRIPYKGSEVEGEPVSTTIIKLVLGLGVVLTMGVGAIFLLRRYLPGVDVAGKGLARRHIELLEIRRITPRLSVFLIEVDGQRHLLAQSGDRVTPVGYPQAGDKARNELP